MIGDGLPRGRFKGVRVSSAAEQVKEPARSEVVDIETYDNDLAETLDALGRGLGINIRVAPGIKESLTVSLKAIPWHESLQVLAKMTQCELSNPEPGLYLLSRVAHVSLDVSAFPFVDACRLIADGSGASVIVAEGVSGNVSLSFRDVSCDEALRLTAEAVGAVVERYEGFYLVTPAPLPPLSPHPKAPAPQLKARQVACELLEVSLGDFAARISEVTGRTVLCDPALGELKLTLSLRSISARAALEAAAAATGCTLQRSPGGVYRFARPHPLAGLSLPEVQLAEALTQAARAAGQNLVVDPSLSGRATLLIPSGAGDLLGALARASGVQLLSGRGGVRYATRSPARPEPSEGSPTGILGGPRGEPLDLDFERIELADALEVISLKAQRIILVSPEVRTPRFSCRLVGLDWREAAQALAWHLGCELQLHPAGRVWFVTQAPTHRLEAERAPLAPLLQALARRARLNVILGAGLEGEVSLSLSGLTWEDALHAVARAGGGRVVPKGDALLIVRDPSVKAPPSARERAFAAGAEPLLAEVRAAASRGDLAALDRASLGLRAWVAGARANAAPAPASAPPLPPALIKALDDEAARCLLALENMRGPEDGAARMADLRALLDQPGGPASARRVWAKLRTRLQAQNRALALSIELVLDLGEGNQLLSAQESALAREDYAGANSAYAKLEQLLERMRGQGGDVFLRNAAALRERGRGLAARAALGERIAIQFPQLRVQAILSEGLEGQEWCGALISDEWVPERQAETKGIPEVWGIEPGRVRFNLEGAEFSRWLR